MPRHAPAALLLAALLAGCSVYDRGLLDAGADAGSDAGPACEATDGGTCLARPPPRPTTTDGDGPEVLFALRHMVLNQGASRWRTIGYDLDGLDTQSATPVTECVPIRAGPVQPDGAFGTDNTFGHAATPLLLAAMPTLETDAQRSQDIGIGAILLDVRGWNGLDDDPRVSVVVSQSVYGTPSLPDGGVPDAAVPDGGPVYFDGGGGIPTPPAWAGSDLWWARDDSFFMADETRPRISDDNAYVAARTLVMRVPDGREIRFSGSTQAIAFTLSDAVLTAHVAADGRTVDRAILAGRWALNDILEAVPRAGVCAGSMNFMLLQSLLEGDVDIRAVPGTGGAGVQCDALSVGLAFDGVKAAGLGGLASPVVPGELCPDGGVADGG